MPTPFLAASLQGHLVVALLLFVLGLAVVLLRRSLLVQLMGLELMLNAANLALLAFGRWRGNDPQAGAAGVFFISHLSLLHFLHF